MFAKNDLVGKKIAIDANFAHYATLLVRPSLELAYVDVAALVFQSPADCAVLVVFWPPEPVLVGDSLELGKGHRLIAHE